MTIFTALDPSTGEVLFSGAADDTQAIAQEQGVTIIEGVQHPCGGYIAGGAWVPIPERPSQHHVWDWATHAWVDPRPAQQALADQWASIKAQRDALLTATDWTLIRALETGEPLPTPWAEYRQTLRDITEQPDPFSIVWPTAPDT